MGTELSKNGERGIFLMFFKILKISKSRVTNRAKVALVSREVTILRLNKLKESSVDLKSKRV